MLLFKNINNKDILQFIENIDELFTYLHYYVQILLIVLY